MQDKPPQDGHAQDDRPDRPHSDLEDVGERLRQARGKSGKGGKEPPADTEPPSSRSAAYRLGSELVAGLLAGAVIGWLLDQWLATKPWLMLVCMLLGFVAGVLNAIRQLKEWNRRSGGS